ncbi:hypothetical protein PD187_003511 [Escherichia coli]|nr:hypothetical protein [Escherichia coli]EHP6576829.1 hypothetical protein [Escherichia coli]EKI2666718.1 hypothetical protein [Escherichia coli]
MPPARCKIIAHLGLDDGSFWPVLEGIPATEMFNVIPLAPGHAYGMFMERFNELSELSIFQQCHSKR